MATLATGGGKTVCFSHLLKQHAGPACLIAHRSELVSQACLTLNREQVPHGIIVPDALVTQIVALEMATHGRSYYAPQAPVRVAGVNTLAVRALDERWVKSVGLVVVDEGHHVLHDNIFGKAVLRFPNARALLPTAHAVRADGRGLGRHADGLADALIVGPSCADLIKTGYLADYRMVCPRSDIDLSHVEVGASGEFNEKQVRIAVHASPTITGDVVSAYLQFAPGKLGLTFAVDVEAAKELTTAYNAVGVPAELITAETPIAVRAQLMRRFRARQLLQLVSVDVLGEGTDVPDIEVVSQARPTASLQLDRQQKGRGLRPKRDGAKAILIDHVQNWSRHGLPDTPVIYSLNRRERRSRAAPLDAIPLRVCLECLQPYERALVQCPYCGAKPQPRGRSAPDLVDGDLAELAPDVLSRLRSEVFRVDGPPPVPDGAADVIARSIRKNHRERQESQAVLRRAVSVWAGWQRHLGRGDSEAQRRFYLTYGVDVLTAQSLGRTEADTLAVRITADLIMHNIVCEAAA